MVEVNFELLSSREEPSSDSVDSFIPQRDTGFMGGQVFFETIQKLVLGHGEKPDFCKNSHKALDGVDSYVKFYFETSLFSCIF